MTVEYEFEDRNIDLSEEERVSQSFRIGSTMDTMPNDMVRDKNSRMNANNSDENRLRTVGATNVLRGSAIVLANDTSEFFFGLRFTRSYHDGLCAYHGEDARAVAAGGSIWEISDKVTRDLKRR